MTETTTIQIGAHAYSTRIVEHDSGYSVALLVDGERQASPEGPRHPVIDVYDDGGAVFTDVGKGYGQEPVLHAKAGTPPHTITGTDECDFRIASTIRFLMLPVGTKAPEYCYLRAFKAMIVSALHDARAKVEERAEAESEPVPDTCQPQNFMQATQLEEQAWEAGEPAGD